MNAKHVHVLDHPLAAAGLSVLRAKQTTPEIFRRHLQEISVLLYFEASRRCQTRSIEVETPLAPCAGAARRPAPGAINSGRSEELRGARSTPLSR